MATQTARIDIAAINAELRERRKGQPSILALLERALKGDEPCETWSCDWCGQDFDWRQTEPAVLEDRVFVVGHEGYEFEETRTLTLCADCEATR